MPQKKSNRKYKNSKNSGGFDKDHLQFKDSGQEYAKVLRNLGGCRLEVFCYDGNTRLAHIRGKMRKRQWIHVNDTILVGLRDFQDNKCDVVHKYKHEEVKRLVNVGEIPQFDQEQETDCAFDFQDI
jgi:translation initiation factor 1A